MLSLSLLVILILVASGICSMLEAAILSAPLTRIRILAERNIFGARSLLAIKERIYKPIAAIVVMNNAVNIVGSIFAGQRAAYLFGSRWLGLLSACLTFLIIEFGEIIPKTIGERYKIPISLIGARPLQVLTGLLYPIIGIATLIPMRISKVVKKPKITEEEIKTLVRLGRDSGSVELDEEALISRVFRLNDLKASQMMTPRDKVFAVPDSQTLGQLKDKILNSPYSRIVIYKNDLDHIVGVCRQRMLLKEIANDRYGERISDLMMRPVFVRGDTRADHLLEKFKVYHQHLFIVQDRFKKTVGIVTMEDVLEELFGEIYDEKDMGMLK